MKQLAHIHLLRERVAGSPRCGLGEADDSYGVLRFWSVGPLCYYCFPEKVGKALEFTNAAAFALVFSSRERHPARVLALMRECLVPAYREGGPMKLLQAFLTLQTSGASPGGATNYLAFAADKGGAGHDGSSSRRPTTTPRERANWRPSALRCFAGGYATLALG
ncbi:hypothetical protein JL721_5546 [Aureococcus anophagefferens]|nr:hypothetical protein JL721_5546 [Aureococcus anophagefferens]